MKSRRSVEVFLLVWLASAAVTSGCSDAALVKEAQDPGFESQGDDVGVGDTESAGEDRAGDDASVGDDRADDVAEPTFGEGDDEGSTAEGGEGEGEGEGDWTTAEGGEGEGEGDWTTVDGGEGEGEGDWTTVDGGEGEGEGEWGSDIWSSDIWGDDDWGDDVWGDDDWGGGSADTGDELGPCECDLNSGYPCACDVLGELCGDGSACLQWSDETELGECMKICDGFGDDESCATGMACGAEGKCVLSLASYSLCGLVCSSKDDCPPGMVCDDSLGAGLCAPPASGPSETATCADCPVGSGYPCPCELPAEWLDDDTSNDEDVDATDVCGADEYCVTLKAGDKLGTCHKPCTRDKDCAVEMACGDEVGSYQACDVAFKDDIGSYCGWHCQTDDDCPTNERCVAPSSSDMTFKLCLVDPAEVP